jgi:hypothetical protein
VTLYLSLTWLAVAVFLLAYRIVGGRLKIFKDRLGGVSIDTSYGEHEAGWRVTLDGEEIAQLDFFRVDPPFYLFRPILQTKDEAKIAYALRQTTSRPPEDRLRFHSRESSVTAADKDFFVHFSDDGLVSIRDLRPRPLPSEEKA